MYKNLEAAEKKAVMERSIDTLRIASIFGSEQAKEWVKKTKGIKPIDISAIKDDRVAEAVVKTVIIFLTSSYFVKHPHLALKSRVLGMRSAVRKHSDTFALDYEGFVRTLETMELKKEPQEIKCALYGILSDGIERPFSEKMCEKDVWYLPDIPMSPDRVDPSRKIKTLSFKSMINAENRELLKKYVKHLVLDTRLSLNTIISKRTVIISALNVAGDTAFADYTEKEFGVLVEYLKKNRKNRSQVGRTISELELFARYMINNGTIERSDIFKYHSLTMGNEYEFRETDRNEYVIAQIFNVLDQVKPFFAQIWFLLMFVTGMRKSEATAIRRNCLERDEESGACYVHFYSQKMKKDVVNIIPEALYEMISEYIQQTEPVSDYLFPSPVVEGAPIWSTSITDKLKREFIRLGVKNPDGTPYIFKPHDLRHWMAKQMYEENIPVQFIQEQLHHSSPEMTMAYVEFMNRRKAEKMRKFVDMNGKNSPIAPMDDRTCADDWHYADYVSKNMNVTVLPNGVCARPKKLGPCGSANSCLTCPEFRTSKEDLQTHKDHLERLDAFIETAVKNGWADQAEESRVVREHLVRIIHALEESGGV